MCERFDFNWQLPTFLASSAANVTLSILKDRTFARMYSARGAPPPLRVPLITYSLFTARDLATVACSFNVPHLVADWIRSSDSDGIPEIVKRNPATAAQLLVPTTLQFLSTPVHLLALDFYNRQGTPTEKVPLASRARFVAREYPVSTFARMMRILPAFGIGGILNRELRLAGNAWLEER